MVKRLTGTTISKALVGSKYHSVRYDYSNSVSIKITEFCPTWTKGNSELAIIEIFCFIIFNDYYPKV